MSESAKRKPGRPRSEEARRNILAAAIDLLEQGGLAAVTMEAIAKQAQVGKPTIYRYWPNAQAVMMTALMEAQPEIPDIEKKGPTLDQLRRHVKAIIAIFATRRGRSAAMLIAAADANTEVSKAFRNHVILKSRSDGKALLDQALKNGELPATLDTDLIADLLYGPIFFRMLLGHQPLDPRFGDALADQVLAAQ